MYKFEKQAIDRLVTEISKRGIKQNQLLAMCNEIGMPISQPDISKICSGGKKLNLYQLASLSKALGKSTDYFVWGEDRHYEDFCDPHGSKVLYDNGEELGCYQGRFHCYFLSTALNEDKLIHGTLDIDQLKESYDVRLSLDTGEKDYRGTPILKKYSGRILVSTALSGAYLIVKSEILGEICMICLRHRHYSLKEAECRLGLVLTISAGEVKEPVAHRCLLVRDELAKDYQEILSPWLHMIGSDVIRIEVGKLDKILEEASEQYPEFADEIKEIKIHALKKQYIDFSVEMMRRQLPLDNRQFVALLSKLYRVSEKIKSHRISQADDICAYTMYTFIQSLP